MGFGSFLSSAGGDLLGSAIGGYANHREGSLNREWSAYMARHAMQFKVQDLKKAGLNPMLAYMQGANPVPSGPGVHHEAPRFGETAQRMAQAKSTGAIAQKEIETLGAQKDKLDSETFVNIASAMEANQRTEMGKVAMVKLNQEIKHGAINIRLSEMDEQERAAMMPWIVGLAKSDALRAEFGLPKLENMAEAEKTWWKREVAPYLGDAAEIVGIASRVTSAGAAASAAGELRRRNDIEESRGSRRRR